MRTVRDFWPILGVVAGLAGCSSSNPFVAHRTTVGSLKASVSQLEFENRQLAQKVADLGSQNHKYENRLVQEESINGDLHARLDDAKALLGKNGLGGLGSDTATADNSSFDPLPPAKARTLPAGRSNRNPRRAPFAQIPGRVEADPDDTSVDDQAGGRSGKWSGDSNPQASAADPGVWLPVARGTEGVSRKR